MICDRKFLFAFAEAMKQAKHVLFSTNSKNEFVPNGSTMSLTRALCCSWSALWLICMSGWPISVIHGALGI